MPFDMLRKGKKVSCSCGLQAALSCGITGDEIKRMVDELEGDSSSWATSWSRLPDISPDAWKAAGVEKGL